MPNRSPVRLLTLALILCAIGTAAMAAAPAAASPPPTHESAKDFDFLHGNWIVHNRKLDKRLAGSTTWIAFDAHDEFHALPGGIGMQEHYVTDHWKSFEALSLNIHDPQTHRWTLYWVDNHNEPIVFQPPVSGAFVGNVGTFEGPDTFGGKPIVVRQTWKSVDADHAHWEQAFSADGGTSWETNWTMEFVRRSPPPAHTAASGIRHENH